MSVNTWESHLDARDNPVLEGAWDDGTPWGFYTHNQVIPPEVPVRTSMCVPVCSLNSYNPQVMLTLNIGRGGFEIPGGHLDPIEDGEVETAPLAAARETGEETGLHVEAGRLIPYGYIEARNAPDTAYPPLTYMQLFGTWASGYPGPITDNEVDGAGVFTLDALHRMAERGAIRTTELGLICLGVRAVLKHHGISDERIRMP